MNPNYQLQLDKLIPGWRSLTSLEIIGKLLDALADPTRRCLQCGKPIHRGYWCGCQPDGEATEGGNYL